MNSRHHRERVRNAWLHLFLLLILLPALLPLPLLFATYR
jgi:predicted nucleic acid-binding Zn ribbon protein